MSTENDAAIDIWRQLLTNFAASVRSDAALALGSLGGAAKPAIPDLCAALLDRDATVRRTAAEAIMQIGSEAESAVPYLLDLLQHHDDGTTRKTSAEILSYIGPLAAASVSALMTALTDESELVQRWAVHALGEIGPAAQQALADLQEICCSSTDMKLRAIALAALRKINCATMNTLSKASGSTLGFTAEPPEIDQRKLARYSCITEVTRQGSQPVEFKPPWLIRVSKISRAGIAIHCGEPFAVATVLTIVLHVPSEKTWGPIQVRVIHVTEQPNGTFLLGTVFLHEIGEEQLRDLVSCQACHATASSAPVSTSTSSV